MRKCFRIERNFRKFVSCEIIELIELEFRKSEMLLLKPVRATVSPKFYLRDLSNRTDYTYDGRSQERG